MLFLVLPCQKEKKKNPIPANSYCAKTVFECELHETVKQEFGGIPHSDHLLSQDQQGQLAPVEVSPPRLHTQCGHTLRPRCQRNRCGHYSWGKTPCARAAVCSGRLLDLDANTSRTLEDKAEWTHHPVRMGRRITNAKTFLQTSEARISMHQCVHRLKRTELSKPQSCKNTSVQDRFNKCVEE